MELTPQRRRRINEALFDYFVAKRILPIGGIISEDNVIDVRIINGLAKQLDCNSKALDLSIKASCLRMTGKNKEKIIPRAEEEKVMFAVAKRRILGSKQPLKDLKRDLGNLAAELKKQNSPAKIKTEELLRFSYPIYMTVFEEICNS